MKKIKNKYRQELAVTERKKKLLIMSPSLKWHSNFRLSVSTFLWRKDPQISSEMPHDSNVTKNHSSKNKNKNEGMTNSFKFRRRPVIWKAEH